MPRTHHYDVTTDVVETTAILCEKCEDPRCYFTSTFNEPLFPPPEEVRAVIVAFPFRFPVTSPVDDTVAVLVLELDQVKL